MCSASKLIAEIREYKNEEGDSDTIVGTPIFYDLLHLYHHHSSRKFQRYKDHTHNVLWFSIQRTEEETSKTEK